MMAPTLTSRNYDYDTVQPYFLLDREEEDFYPPPQSHLLPGPGEDIWKKFELLLTPPLSPSRTPPQNDSHLSAAEHLDAVSDLLDEDTNSSSFLQSFIIQDCMWSSSFAAASKLERMVSKRLASLQSRRDSSDTDSIPDVSSEPQVSRSQVKPEYLQDLHTAASKCINPGVVFPFATTSEKQNLDGEGMEMGSELDLESPQLSSSDSESEEEEEDGEEAEIDVVTVDRRRTSRPSEASPLVLKRSHINVQQHNYAAPRPVGKRRRTEATGTGQSRRRRCWSPWYDGEDKDKRRTHNVLERQRRNELRVSFLSLRDEVPELKDKDKTSKVVILKKATEFIMELSEEEDRIRRTKDELMKRSEELRGRLQLLRTFK
nr:transcriptional regulator Myc-1 isoform X1 [Nothobranchius furzeri]